MSSHTHTFTHTHTHKQTNLCLSVCVCAHVCECVCVCVCVTHACMENDVQQDAVWGNVIAPKEPINSMTWINTRNILVALSGHD